jgi:O-antigen ligase
MILRFFPLLFLIPSIFLEVYTTPFFDNLTVSKFAILLFILYSIPGFFLKTTIKFPRQIRWVIVFLVIFVGVNLLSLVSNLGNNEEYYIYSRNVFLLYAFYSIFTILLIEYIYRNHLDKFSEQIFWLSISIQVLIGLVEIVSGVLRPDGTMGHGDSDFYAMALSFSFSILIIDILLNSKHNRFKIILAICMGIVLFFTGVRSTWISILISIVIAILANRNKIFNARFLFKAIFSIFSVFILTYITSIFLPHFYDFISGRFALEDGTSYSIMENTRLIIMMDSIDIFFESPILGNGPASYSIYGLDSGVAWTEPFAWDPSLLTTVLADVGLVGFLCGVLLIISLFKLNSYKVISVNNIPTAKIWLYSLIGLIFSFSISNAILFPFFWLYFSLTLIKFKGALK